ncbi:MAG: hypothetical protein JEY94_07305 [Melioribacteraceae bacterium]|nr:hypothetical protein [Melioribacteraceae bacterium]
MNEGKKIWFVKVSYNLWIPVSWEGWLTLSMFSLVLLLVYKLNNVSDDVVFSFKEHWHILLEFVIPTIMFYLITRGRTDKRT